MAGMKTEFQDGTRLFYPLESLPALFKTIGAVSKKGFFEKIAQLDGVGGEGIPIETYTEMVRTGLQWEQPAITTETATSLVKKFYEINGYDALESIIIDAFADSGLSDKSIIEKRKAYVLELKELDLERLRIDILRRKAFLAGKEAETVPELPPEPTEEDDRGEEKTKLKIKPQPRKRRA